MGYMLKAVAFMEDAVQFETSKYRHCLRRELQKYKVSYGVADVWATAKFDERGDDPPQPPMQKDGSHVIAYGMFGKFEDFQRYTDRRHVVEKQLTRTLEAVSKEPVETVPYFVRVPIAITIDLSDMVASTVELPVLADQWARKVEPGLRAAVREDKKGGSLEGKITLKPMDVEVTVKPCTCEVMKYILKDADDGSSLSKDALLSRIMELMADDRMSWKRKSLEIMKPSIFIEFEKASTSCGMTLIDTLILSLISFDDNPRIRR